MSPCSQDLPEPLICSRWIATAPFPGRPCTEDQLPVTVAPVPGPSMK